MKELRVVVMGQPHSMAVAPDTPLSFVVSRALHETRNVGRPPDHWELRQYDGVLLDQNHAASTVAESALPLFLSLFAGFGG